MANPAPNGGQPRELVSVKDRAITLRTILEERKLELRAALPRHLSPERIMRLTMTAVAKNPKLLNCTAATIYSAVLQCAQLGLEPELLGQAYLVPYRNNKKGVYECQLIPGYLGLLALARRSGEIASIEARVVRAGDIFDYEYGLNQKLVHKPEPQAKGDVTHVYAIARFKHGGEPQWTVMTTDEVARHRARSRASGDGPWVTDYDAMALKTVLRVLCKLLPASVELRTAVALDEAADAGLPQDLPIATGSSSSEPDTQEPETQEHPPVETEGVSQHPADDCGCPDAQAGQHFEQCPESR